MLRLNILFDYAKISRFFGVCAFLCGISTGLYSQQPEYKKWVTLNNLEYVSNLPKYLLESKSIVVLIGNNRHQIEEIGERVHQTFKKGRN